MKTIRRIIQVLLISIMLFRVSTGCHNGSGDKTIPLSSCRIQEYDTPADKTTYTYDSEGRLLGWELTLNTGGKTSTASYVYDADGYLTASISNNQLGQLARQTTTSRAYRYSSGRLVSYVSETTPGTSPGSRITGTFEYDALGELITERATFVYTTNPDQSSEGKGLADGNQQTWSYVKGQLVDYTYKKNASSAETHPHTIVNGRITQIDGHPAFEYDNQGRLTKSIVYNDAVLNSYYVMEYDDGKSCLETLPAFKGFPSIKSISGAETNLQVVTGSLGFVPKTVLKSFTYFANYGTYGVVQLTKNLYTNQINNAGYVIKTTAVNTSTTPGFPTQQYSPFTTSYSYTNCN